MSIQLGDVAATPMSSNIPGLIFSFHIIFLYFSFHSCFHMKNEELSLLTQAEEIEEHLKSNLSYGTSMYTFQLWQQTWTQSARALLIT